MFKHKHRVKIVGVLLGIAVTAGFSVFAHAQSVTQTYTTSGQVLHNGTIVRLKDGSPTAIEPLSQRHAKDMLGVVTAPNDAPVSLSTESDQQQAYVATTGQYNVLVSTQEGPVAIGDFITISALHGIGMKAADDDQIVVGKALASFDGKASVDGTASIKVNGGNERKVVLGHIPVDITIAHNPFYKADKVDGVPSFLASAASSVSDKRVGALRIYAALVVLIVSLAAAGFIIYAGVRNGMVAAGRNPLANKSIMRNLLQVVLVAFIVFIISLIAVYLLLKL